MDNTKNKKQKDSNCELPETRSISEIVHKHLRDKNDHITDEDIRNAEIDPNANELDDLHTNDIEKNKQDNNSQNEKNEDGKMTPWDVVDKNATE
jgi:hypothetical protein